MALRSVDFPEPFSPMKNVTGQENSNTSLFRKISRLNG
jgi:hypothetical protein